MHWKILKSKKVLENDFFQVTEEVCEKPDGHIVEEYYTIHRNDAAIIAAFTEKMDLILIKQYRHPVQAVDLELPAGYINEDESDISLAAARELLEETGYASEKLVKLSENYASAGLMNNKVHFFIGLNAKKVQEQNLDPNESIEVHLTPWAEVEGLLKAGKIKDLGSSAGILLAKNYLEKL